MASNKRIHVNVNLIRHNKKHGSAVPVCRVEEGKKVRYCREVHINGPSKMIYSPQAPLVCGATLWIETTAEVELIGETPYSEIAEAIKQNA